MNTEQRSSAVSRRTFLETAAAMAAVALPAGAPSTPANVRRGLVDVNINLFRWPMRRLPCDETAELVAKLRRQGVSQAWAGSYEGLFHKDLGAVNQRLSMECRHEGRGLLLPFGCVNPKAPDWEEELRRCAEVYRMPGIRLHPNYHGYQLDDPEFGRLLRRATDYQLIVQLAVIMEDERTGHPRIRLESVDLKPLVEAVRQTPGLRLVLLNALRSWQGEFMRSLLSAGNVYVEIAMLEGVGGVARLLEQLPTPRVLFGSHAPFYYFESALLKLKESKLTQEQEHAIRTANARRLLEA